VCDTCRAALIIWIPALLSPARQEELSRKYQRQLAESHELYCIFQPLAQRYMDLTLEQHQTGQKQDDGPRTCSMAFSILSTYFPSQEREIFLHPRPHKLLRAIWSDLVMAHLEAWNESKGPSLFVVPSEITQLTIDSHFNNSPLDISSPATTETKPWIQDLVGQWSKDGKKETEKDDSHNHPNLAAYCAALCLLGWRLVPNQPFVLECPLCLSRLQMKDGATSTFTTNHEHSSSPSNNSLIVRSSHPLWAHRYYCPIICFYPGFVTDRPLWQVVATRLSESIETPNSSTSINTKTGSRADPAASWESIHNLLRQAISTRKRKVDLAGFI
jgi:hypothetical protein